MLLFSARILADFTQQTLAVRRLPHELRNELGARSLGQAVHEDLGSRRAVELLLEWLCRAQDIGVDGRVASGFDPLHGWRDPAAVRCQLVAIRCFISAADVAGDGVFRRRARRIAAAYIAEETADPGSAAESSLLPAGPSLVDEADALRMRTAAQQLFGLGSYKTVITAAGALLQRLAETGRLSRDEAVESWMLARIGAVKAIFDVAWVTRDSRFVDEGIRILDQLLGIERRRLDDDPPQTAVELATTLCDALLDGYRLSLHNRFLHEASHVARPIIAELGKELRGAAADGAAALHTNASWNTRDLSLMAHCLRGFQTLQHLRKNEAALASQLTAVLRRSVLCIPVTNFNGSVPTSVPARGALGAVSRCSEAAGLLLSYLLAEQQAERHVGIPLSALQ